MSLSRLGWCVAIMALTACHRREVTPLRPMLPDSLLSDLDAQRVARLLGAAVRNDSASPLLRARTFCLALRDRAGSQFFDTAHASAWALHRPTVPMHACPRTYASMRVEYDAKGRVVEPPRGYVDPHRITVRMPVADSLGWSAVVEFGHGMAAWEKTCRSGSDGVLRCALGLYRIS